MRAKVNRRWNWSSSRCFTSPARAPVSTTEHYVPLCTASICINSFSTWVRTLLCLWMGDSLTPDDGGKWKRWVWLLPSQQLRGTRPFLPARAPVGSCRRFCGDISFENDMFVDRWLNGEWGFIWKHSSFFFFLDKRGKKELSCNYSFSPLFMFAGVVPLIWLFLFTWVTLYAHKRVGGWASLGGGLMTNFMWAGFSISLSKSSSASLSARC